MRESYRSMIKAKKKQGKSTDPLNQKPANRDRKKVNKMESKLFDKEKQIIDNMSQIFDYKKNQELLNRIQQKHFNKYAAEQRKHHNIFNVVPNANNIKQD